MNQIVSTPDNLSLAQYSRSSIDRSYADQHETLLGHLVCERGQELKSALEDLRPTAKQAHRQTLIARDACQKMGLAGIAIGVLVGASPLGIAFGLPPLLAGSLALKFWGDSRSELPKRLAEYHTLKIAPNLPEALWAFHLRGLNPAALIGAYDQLIDAIETRMEDGRDFSESEIKEFLQAKIQEEPLTQQGFQPSNDQGATAQKTETLAQTELQPIGPGVAAAPSVQHIVKPVWNPAQDLGENPQSALIVGVPGSGKGMVISNAIRFLKGKHPDLKVFVIDPKASPKERGYWESIADEYHAFSLKNCANPDEGATWLLDCMDAFRRLPGPKLCIFDELMTAATELELADSKMKALPRLKKFVVGLVGQGDSEGEWLWAMTQSPQVKDLGMSGGVRANLRVIGLVSPKNQTAIEALVSTQLIPKPDGGMDELREIMKASPCGRAVFDGKIARWLPMPVLENHSGFDRDNRNLDDEKPTGRLEDAFPAEFFKDHPLLTKDKPWETSHPIDVQVDEVETVVIDDKPDGLESFPLVLTIWEYLAGKDARSIKQISDAMKAKGKIPEDTLRTKLGQFETYKEAIKTVVSFGVKQGYLKQISEDAYEAIKRH